MSLPAYLTPSRASAMRLLLEPAPEPSAEGTASSLMAQAHNPTDPSPAGRQPAGQWDGQRAADQLPPGLLANQQRACEEAAELAQWQAYDLQWQVFHRLREFSVNHGSQAWRLRYRTPLSAYALAYLFTQPADPGSRSSQLTVVRAATRLWKAGPESQHPVPLLSSLTGQVRGRDPRLVWDLREQIANRSDDGMTADAVYLGLGLSSLDTHTGAFAQVCQTATNEMDIPGVFLFLATGSADPVDQQVIIADRRCATDHNVTTVHAHRALSLFRLQAPYPFAHVELETLYQQSGYGQLLRWMWELDRALHEADHARREAATRRRTGRGRS
ncbi:hypothetical protein [Paractinoplanes rishiriensis]|uniref:Uncharacterized protein n=1 Tax=Paractinoplanes rishiriensis TaxID=1050105 RepID=A0A919MZD8_9ACTN|nr:hypothetical protein [Actinoplanes rishiriensis]GIF01110.1 hypothetical protein Ari01nite_85740 [Actinoplanes rishiriensis]